MAGTRSLLPLALLVDTFDDEYVVAVVRGALAGAKEAGVSLLCVTGGRIADSDPERAARNFAFDLVGRENTRGVIAVSSVIGSAVGPLELKSWLTRFDGLATYCVGVPIAGYASIAVDNVRGIRELVSHQVRTHESRRIAFLRGPVASAEAATRFRAFESTLRDEGVAFDPNLVAEGDFTKESGVAAVRYLLDERRVPPAELDAIVAANDYMALGAMQELWRRQLDVPGDVAVLGFDDVDSARRSRPMLTTARQPTELLGRRAVQAVLELVQGKLEQDARFLPTELVLRQSCGCPSSESSLATGVSHAPGRGIGMSFVQRRHIILAEVSRAAAGRLGALGSDWEARLLDALMLELREGGRSSFYRAFEQLLGKLDRVRVEGSVVQDVLSALRRQALPCVASVATARDELEDALHEARVLASAFSEAASDRRGRLAREQQRACETGLRSALSHGASKLSDAAADRLPDSGVDACVVAKLARPGEPASQATLLFGFGPSARVTARQPTTLSALPSHEVFDNASALRILMPLVTRGQASGVAIVAMGLGPDQRIEELRDLFSNLLELAHAVH